MASRASTPWGCASTSEATPAIALALALIGACRAPPPDPAHADRAAYIAAAAKPGDPNACLAISAAPLRAECVAMAAGALAAQGHTDPAFTICRGMQPGPWREECVFLVVEDGDLEPEVARDACAESGRFADRCRGHMLRRLAAGVLDQHPPGDEPAALAALETLARTWTPRAARPKARHLLSEHLAGRLPEALFSRAHCGDADPELCATAYQHRVQMAGRAQSQGTRDFGAAPPPWLAACPPPVPVGRAAGLGLPAWDPDMDEVVQQAWVTLCGPAR